MFWDRDPLFLVDVVLFLHLLSLCYTSPRLLYCFLSYWSLSQLVQVQHRQKRWVQTQPGVCAFPTYMQRVYSSLMLPNNIISKAPYKNMSNQASDKGLSVYLFEQYQIATICSSYLVSLFQSHFVGTGLNSAGMQEDGDLFPCLKKSKCYSFLGRFFFFYLSNFTL